MSGKMLRSEMRRRLGGVAGVYLVGPEVGCRVGAGHGGRLVDWVGELRKQLVTTYSGPRQFSFSAQSLGITDDLAAISLPSVVTPATDHTGALGRKQFGIDDKSALTGVGDVF